MRTSQTNPNANGQSVQVDNLMTSMFRDLSTNETLVSFVTPFLEFCTGIQLISLMILTCGYHLDRNAEVRSGQASRLRAHATVPTLGCKQQWRDQSQ